MVCDAGCGAVFEGYADELVHHRAERADWLIVDGCEHYCPACRNKVVVTATWTERADR